MADSILDPVFSDVLADQYDRPIAGAEAWVYTVVNSIAGPLAALRDVNTNAPIDNPTRSNDRGVVQFKADAGTYRVDYRVGGISLLIKEVIVGNPPQYIGSTGPANSTYTTLAALKAAAVTNASYIFAPPSGSDGGAAAGTFLYQTAGAPYTADGVNVIKLDTVPLTTGALVRQGAQGVAYIAKAQPPVVPQAAVDDRLNRDPYVTSFGVPVDGSAVNTKMADLLAGFDTSGGAGARVVTPKGRLRMSASPFAMRDRIVFEGQAIRAAIVAVGAGSGFVFDGLEHAGLRRMRIGLDSAAGIIAIDVKATSSDARTHIFENLEIAGAEIAGQIGMRFTRSGEPILSENITENVILTNIDQPIIDLDSEGNFRKVIIDGFAYGGSKIAIDARSHANLDIARIARANTAGSTGYKQAGTRNIAILYTDLGPTIGPLSDALNITGTDNLILLQRPENSTRLGSWVPGNMILDGANAYPRRTLTRGTSLINGNFALTGWGNAATVSVSKGDDQSGRIVIMAAGTGMTANPMVTLTYSDGAWPFPPKVLLVQRGGGNQPTADRFFTRNVGVSSWNFAPLLTPVDGEAYEFDYFVG